MVIIKSENLKGTLEYYEENLKLVWKVLSQVQRYSVPNAIQYSMCICVNEFESADVPTFLICHNDTFGISLTEVIIIRNRFHCKKLYEVI